MNFSSTEINREFKDWLDIRFEKLYTNFPVLSNQYVEAYLIFINRDSVRYWKDEIYKHSVSIDMCTLGEELYRELEIIIAQDLHVYQIEDLFSLDNARDIFIYMERYILRKYGVHTNSYKID